MEFAAFRIGELNSSSFEIFHYNTVDMNRSSESDVRLPSDVVRRSRSNAFVDGANCMTTPSSRFTRAEEIRNQR